MGGGGAGFQSFPFSKLVHISCNLVSKTTFPSSDSKSARALDLIHSNLCGPMSITSLKGNEYYVTFIDDFSKKTRIYFLKSKESKEVLQKFKEFKALVENQQGESKFYDLTMGESITLRSLMLSIFKKESRDR